MLRVYFALSFTLLSPSFSFSYHCFGFGSGMTMALDIRLQSLSKHVLDCRGFMTRRLDRVVSPRYNNASRLPSTTTTTALNQLSTFANPKWPKEKSKQKKLPIGPPEETRTPVFLYKTGPPWPKGIDNILGCRFAKPTDPFGQAWQSAEFKQKIIQALDSRGLKWSSLDPLGVEYRDDDDFEPPFCPVCLWVWVKIGMAEAKSVLDPAGLGDVPVAVEETVYWVSAAYLL